MGAGTSRAQGTVGRRAAWMGNLEASCAARGWWWAAQAVGGTAVSTAGMRSRPAARARRRGAPRGSRSRRTTASVLAPGKPCASLSAPARVLRHARLGVGSGTQRAPCGERGGRGRRRARRARGPRVGSWARAELIRGGPGPAVRRGAEEWAVGGCREARLGHEEREAGRADAEREAPAARGTRGRARVGCGGHVEPPRPSASP